jgi:AraC-like DNA-binding protein
VGIVSETSGLLEFKTIEGLEGVTVVHSLGPVRACGRHIHESLTFGVVVSGKRLLCIDKVTHEADAGCVLCIGPNKAHSYVDAGICEYVMFSVPSALVAALGFTQTRPAFSSPTIDSPRLSGMILRLFEAVNGNAFVMERQSQLMAILSIVLGTEHGAEDTPRNITRAARYLESNYDENIGLDELAQIAELSPCRFNRRFAQAFGMPPHEYHNQIRTQEAKRLLAAGVSLAETAVHCGFNDQSHMNRIFKKLVGLTPGHYAKAYRQKHESDVRIGAAVPKGRNE